MLNLGDSAGNIYASLCKVKRFKEILYNFTKEILPGKLSCPKSIIVAEIKTKDEENTSIIGKRSPEKINNENSCFQPRSSSGKQVVKE